MAFSIGRLAIATQLLLLLCTATAAAVTIPGNPAAVNGAAPPPAEATASSDGLPKLRFPFSGGAGGVPHHFPFPFPGRDPAGCLKAVHQAESCVVDVLRSLVSPPAGGWRASAACCAGLQAVGDRCFRGSLLLPVSPFRALYGALVKHACGVDGQGMVPGGPRP